MRRIARLAALCSLLLLVAAPAAAQPPPPPPVALPLISAGCVTGPICASLVVGPTNVCCMGGRPGDQIQIPVTFLAMSRAGGPLEMRTNHRSCSDTSPIDPASPWEPHVTERHYPHTLAVNWHTWSLRVQFRDAAGNLSPVLCDDVALEGY